MTAKNHNRVGTCLSGLTPLSLADFQARLVKALDSPVLHDRYDRTPCLIVDGPDHKGLATAMAQEHPTRFHFMVRLPAMRNGLPIEVRLGMGRVYMMTREGPQGQDRMIYAAISPASRFGRGGGFAAQVLHYSPRTRTGTICMTYGSLYSLVHEYTHGPMQLDELENWFYPLDSGVVITDPRFEGVLKRR